jgi:uncharacterized Zn finger protein
VSPRKRQPPRKAAARKAAPRKAAPRKAAAPKASVRKGAARTAGSRGEAVSPRKASGRKTSARQSPPDPSVLRALRTRLDALEASSGGKGRRAGEHARRADLMALRALVARALGEDTRLGEDQDAWTGAEDDADGWDDGPAGWGRAAGPDNGWDDADGWDDERAPGRVRRWFPASKPIPVEGGLTARTRRGAIGESWWSRRFLAAIEAVVVGGRLTRGRSYARKGQVIDLDIGPGLVEAHVQGSRKDPYRVRLAIPVVEGGDWDRIVAAFAAEAGYAARLLAGELPHEAEAVFAAEGSSLFPGPGARLATGCTCPDFENPCKHVAAVFYLLAEAFDRDPFLVLQWRGRGRDEVLAQLRGLRRGAASVLDDGPVGPAARTGASDVDAPALADCVPGFWKAGPDLADVRIRPALSEVPDAVLRNVARGLVEVRGKDLGQLLAPVYAVIAASAARRAVGGDLRGHAGARDETRSQGSSVRG